MTEILIGAAYVAIFILFYLGQKLWLSLDKYFEKKAENMATKQDITEITRRTETVQAEFHKVLSKFDADLKFKYEFYEKQYTELYSELFYEICNSEALRYVLVNICGKHLEFANVPILKCTLGKKGHEDTLSIEENSIEKKIINLVYQKHIYASPELLKLICTLDKVLSHKKNEKMQKSISQITCELKIKLVKTILKDYHWLRKQLMLQNSEDEIFKLETGTFISNL